MRITTIFVVAIVASAVTIAQPVDPRDIVLSSECPSNAGAVCTWSPSPPEGTAQCTGLGICSDTGVCEGEFQNDGAYCYDNSAGNCGQCDPNGHWCNLGLVDPDPSGGEQPCLDLNAGTPIELLSISATVSNGSIIISWQTATELNNAGFWVDLSQDDVSYRRIAFVEGIGTSLIEQSYEIAVDPIGVGKHFIRLQQIDFDGTATWLPVIEVDLAVPEGFALDAAYPNPFNPTTTITFTVATDMDVELQLLDTSGRILDTIFNGAVAANLQKAVRFSNSDLPSGTYFYRLMTPVGSQVRSFSIVR